MSGRARPARQRRAELSQHFLHAAAAAEIVQATSISHSDLVVEIGAGRGALTKALLHRTQRITAVELDTFLAARLQQTLGPGVQVVAADFLRWPLPQDTYRVLGNVPYAITTGIIRKLAFAANPPADAWLVVQQELARRMCGPPYQGETLWSLRLKPFWHLEVISRLPKTSFNPPPQVDSALLWMSYRPRPLLDNRKAWQDLLQHSFNSRKPMGETLRRYVSKTRSRRLCRDLHFAPGSLPSELIFEQWLGVFRYLQRVGALDQ